MAHSFQSLSSHSLDNIPTCHGLPTPITPTSETEVGPIPGIAFPFSSLLSLPFNAWSLIPAIDLQLWRHVRKSLLPSFTVFTQVMASVSLVEGVIAEIEVELIATEAAEHLATAVICKVSISSILASSELES
jgi:hypothetical protein